MTGVRVRRSTLISTCQYVFCADFEHREIPYIWNKEDLAPELTVGKRSCSHVWSYPCIVCPVSDVVVGASGTCTAGTVSHSTEGISPIVVNSEECHAWERRVKQSEYFIFKEK